MKHIYLLGATGSIGTQTLDIIRTNSTSFKLIGMAYGNNLEKAIPIIKEFKPLFVSTAKNEDVLELKKLFPELTVVSGDEGLIDIATRIYQPEIPSLLVNALMGGVGLKSTLAAIEIGRDVALANKETLVMAGELVINKAKEYGVNLLPIDSEHSAIWQCLNGEDEKKINKIIITASGGSFRDLSRNELENVTKEAALNHPNWSMGSKITIDSATMMNKGLEVIEAHYLFNLPYERIDTILHAQSIVHSMVEFVDTSIIAHLGTADMKIPIAYAMNYPNRQVIGNTSSLELAKIGTLDFKEMDFERFPCLQYAYEAGKKGDTYPLVLNAANEEAVNLFLNDKITFLQIETIIKEALDSHVGVSLATLEQILEINDEVRRIIRSKYS